VVVRASWAVLSHISGISAQLQTKAILTTFNSNATLYSQKYQMDHIPTPLDSLPGIDIPITKIVPYDFQGFTTFPSRYGFGSEKPLGEEQSADDTASLMQSWLYFGLLAEFFGEPCTQSLLCLAPLNRLMKSHSPEKDRQPLLLQKACEMLRIFLKSPHYFTSPVLEQAFYQYSISI